MSAKPAVLQALPLLPALERGLAGNYTVHKLPPAGPEREAFLAARNGATLIPFLLEGVGAVPELNQPDLIHPTAEGQSVIAGTVWAHLRSLLQ